MTREFSPRNFGELADFVDRLRATEAPRNATVTLTRESTYPGEHGSTPQSVRVRWTSDLAE